MILTTYLRASLIIALYSTGAISQGDNGAADFDKAIISPSRVSYWADQRIPGINTNLGTTLFFANISLRTLISLAFGVSNQQIYGPEWMSRDNFDVTAVVPRGTDSNQIRQMLQRLLTKRFGMEVAHDTDVIRLLTLQVAQQGHKLRASAQGGVEAPGCIRSFDPNTRTVKATCHEVDASGMAEQLQVLAGRHVAGMPIIDGTGLHGVYDFVLSWTADTNGKGADNSTTLFEAINKQLGLELVPRKRIVDIVLIKRMDRWPTAE